MSFDNFQDSQKIIYELKPASTREQNKFNTDYYKQNLYYQESVPTNRSNIPFTRLLEGKEPIKNLEFRYELFKRNWSSQLKLFNSVINKNDRNKFKELESFLYKRNDKNDKNDNNNNNCPHLQQQQQPQSYKRRKLNGNGTVPNLFFNKKLSSNYKLNSVLLRLGSNIANHPGLLNNVFDNLKIAGGSSDVVVVRLNSKFCNNSLETTLRIIHSSITELDNGHNVSDSSDSDSEDDDNYGDNNEILRIVNDVDLQDVFETMSNSDKKITLLIEDADSFQSDLLSELINVLWNYSNDLSIDIQIVLGISTPIIMFKDKIPRLTLQKLNLMTFNVDNSDKIIEEIMNNMLLNINDDPYTSLIFEPDLILNFIKMKSNVGISQFYNYMKLIYMQHYFNQPLSIFWSEDYYNSKVIMDEKYYEAFQRLPSVSSFNNSDDSDNNGEQEDEDTKETVKFYKALLNGNFKSLKKYLDINRIRLVEWKVDLRNLIEFLNFLQGFFLNEDEYIWSNNLELFEKLFSKSNLSKEDELLLNSDSRFNFLTSVWTRFKKMKLTVINRFIKELATNDLYDFIFTDFELQHNIENEDDINYLIESFRKILRNQLNKLKIEKIPFKEICVIEFKNIQSLLTNSFNPKIRDNVLNSMMNSKHYLFNKIHTDMNNENILPEIEMFKLYEPSTIEIFKLYREANININIYDFYQVFKYSIRKKKALLEIMKLKLKEQPDKQLSKLINGLLNQWNKELLSQPKETEEAPQEEDLNAEGWDEITLSWFLKGLTELQMLGLLKEGRKDKNETVQKLVWKGL